MPDTLDNEQCVSPTDLMMLPKSCRSTRTGAGVGPGVGTGIGSATAADKKDEAMRATAARRANMTVKRRGCDISCSCSCKSVRVVVKVRICRRPPGFMG